jgi:carboxylesterase type B
MGNCEIAGEITALQCSQRCIKAFGGDPDRVTIFGPSAGAGAFRALLGSPPAIGTFAGAIMESNLDGLAYAAEYSEYYTIEKEVRCSYPRYPERHRLPQLHRSAIVCRGPSTPTSLPT